MRPAILMHLLDEVPEHLLRHLEVGDHAVLERADGLDVAGRAAQHALGLDADGVHLARALVDRDDRRLGQHDAATAHVDQRVGRAEVDGHVAAAERAEVVEDAHFRLAEPWRDTSECARMQGDSTPQPGNGATALAQHLDQQRDRQADHVEEASLDARHERRPGLLDRVAAGAALPLAARHVLVDRRAVERAEAHRRARRAPCARRARRAASGPTRRGASRPASERQHAAPPRPRPPACRAPARRRRRACRRPAPSRPRRASTERALPRLCCSASSCGGSGSGAPRTSARRRGSRGRAA